MKTLIERLEEINWRGVAEDMHNRGYAQIKNVLNKKECDELIKSYDSGDIYRKTISMERYRFGLGEYKYFQYPLPARITDIRETAYRHIAPIANQWMQALNTGESFPATHKGLQKLCADHGQTKPTVLILKYGMDGFNTLHQDLYGKIYFPVQLVLFLNEPEEDYTGGEFVLTEQIPRAQSKANVISPGRGDMLLFTTNFRPAKGKRGYYRVNMKHGVSPLHSGHRHTLGIIFHDALS